MQHLLNRPKLNIPSVLQGRALNCGIPRHACRMRTNAGFGMIEVAVAFLLLSLGLGVLLGGLTMGLRSTDRAAQAGLALLHAESLMAAAQAGPLIPGETTGRTDSGFVWQKQISLLPLSGQRPVTPFKISIAVTPPGKGAPVRLDSMLLSDQKPAR